MKRLLIVGLVALAVVAAALVLAAGQATRRAEGWVARALDRPVALEGVRWAWPVGLDVDRVVLAGTGVFTRADILIAERVRVRLRPLALLRGALEVSSAVVGDLLVRVHHYQGAITHPLSRPTAAGDASSDQALSGWLGRVHELRVENGTIEFFDHDAPFVDQGVLRDRFEATVSAIRAEARTVAGGDVRYEVNGQLGLGDQYPDGRVVFTAVTAADTGETDAELQVDGAAVPAFNAYLSRATSTSVERGLVAVRSRTQTANRVWTTNARVELTGLAIAGDGNRPGPSLVMSLFGDPSGAASLDVDFTWNRANPHVTFQQALSSGIRSAVQARAAASLPTMLGELFGGRQGGRGGLGSLLEGLAGAGRGKGPGGQRSPWESLFEGRRQPDR